MSVVTKQDLARALRLRLAIDSADAETRAERVLDFFGFDDRVIDNVLDTEDRQLFYTLQDRGLLTTRSEETDLWNGQAWRTHYWVMRAERVAALSRAAASEEARAAEADALAATYAALPASAWAHR